MRLFLALTVLLLLRASAAPNNPLKPEDVVILYNRAVPESVELAAWYCAQRNIPEGNLLGLDLPNQDEITREQYQQTLAEPLRAEFERRRWWQIGSQPEIGRIAQVTNKRVIAIMKGVPRLISATAPPSEPSKEDNASVDAELAAIGLLDLPIVGPINNPYYQKDSSFRNEPLAPFFLIGRLDGPDYATARRMVDDAVATEARGLWGHCYIDQDDQYPEGAAWLNTVATEASNWGFPVIAEPTGETFPTNYPMEHCALYYGWYDHNFSGPLRNHAFRYRRGAIAVHIHSFSATSLAADANWCGPILAHGAAATLGHVYEPYLGLTHHLDIFNNRLLQGYSFAEAAHMSLPAVSWMWTNLGDPLYRPFAAQTTLNDEDYLAPDDNRPWRTLRLIALSHPSLNSRLEALRQQAGNDPILLEALASTEASRGRPGLDAARSILQRASEAFTDPRDQLRCQLQIALIDQLSDRPRLAEEELQALLRTFASLPEAQAALTMLERLNPPAPAPVR